MIHFIVHGTKDTVGVAVTDIEADQEVNGWILENDDTLCQTARQAIPLGHKMALADARDGDAIIKYNVPIGNSVRPIQKGDHVHTHNLKSARW